MLLQVNSPRIKANVSALTLLKCSRTKSAIRCGIKKSEMCSRAWSVTVYLWECTKTSIENFSQKICNWKR
jgi:hypothetical protein